jgi:hypothetical protein
MVWLRLFKVRMVQVRAWMGSGIEFGLMIWFGLG